jgi:hypothetical protein
MGNMEINNVLTSMTASVAQWLEFLATDPEVLVRFPALPGFSE